MNTVFAKICAFVMTLCLLALPLTSEATPHACQKQHTQQHKQAKSCHKDDVPECCKEKQGAAPKHTCCQVAPVPSYAKLEKTELEHTLKLVQKQVVPTIISPKVVFLIETISMKGKQPFYSSSPQLTRNIPILFQQFLC